MRPFLLLPSLAACAFQAPLADDPRIGPAVVSGTLIVSGPAEPATTIVLAYRAEDPPPPVGTGRPLTFATVSADRFVRRDGVFEAPYAISIPGIASGEVLVTALVDVDENFFPLPPFSEVLAGATCGDFLGAHVTDLQEGAPAPVAIEAGRSTEGVAVLVAREATFERPAFVMQGGTPFLSRELAAGGSTQTFRVASTRIAAVTTSAGETLPLLDLSGPFDGTDPCDTALWVTIWDRDGDGQPDPHPDFPPETGLIDAWPRVVLQYLGEIDADGVVEPTLEPGESWAMRAALFPDVAWFGVVPLNRPTPLTEAEIVFVPGAQHTRADGTVEVVTDPTALPAGAWSVTLINVAGQTWTLPNALARVGSFDPANYAPAGQAGAVVLE